MPLRHHVCASRGIGRRWADGDVLNVGCASRAVDRKTKTRRRSRGSEHNGEIEGVVGVGATGMEFLCCRARAGSLRSVTIQTTRILVDPKTPSVS